MPKILQISLKDDTESKLFELLEIKDDTYMLKTKNEHHKLFKILKEWLQEYAELDEDDYTNSLIKRADYDMDIDKEILSGEFSRELSKDFTNENFSVINDETKKPIPEIYQIPETYQIPEISKIDYDHLYIGAECGNLIDYSISQKNFSKLYHNILEKTIYSMAITSDKKDLF